MDEPEEEECQHATSCDADGSGNMIRDVGEFMTKNTAEDVGHEACAGVHFSSGQ
jgi:hypothetical protein